MPFCAEQVSMPFGYMHMKAAMQCVDAGIDAMTHACMLNAENAKKKKKERLELDTRFITELSVPMAPDVLVIDASLVTGCWPGEASMQYASSISQYAWFFLLSCS